MKRNLTLYIVALLLLTSAVLNALTLKEHLDAAPKPVFKEGHTLPPLARWGWSMPYDVTVELCESWGYALEFGSYATTSAAEKAHDPETRQGKVCALTKSNPERYPLFVITDRPLKDMEKAEELPESYWLHNAEGKRLEGPSWKRRNPEAPDEIFQRVAEKTIAPLKRIQEICPITVILHGGESGLTELGHSRKFLEQDPAAVKARGDRSWWDFYSEHKARWLMPTISAIRKTFPDRKVLIWYHFGGMPGWAGKSWSWNYEYMKTVADTPGQSIYYKHFNSGWTGKQDLLSNFLCSVAQAKTYDDSLSYNWVCAGWGERKFSDIDRYTGFLKCLYTAGAIGNVAGYFSLPEGFKGQDVGDEPPNHLQQMMALGRVQALFSHLEEFLRQGSLLPGPLKHKNSNAADLPAYEFPTGDETARVLIRKHNTSDRWLVTAWAADGDARNVSVEIPGLEPIEVLARPEGSVYIVSVKSSVAYEPPKVEVKLLDVDGMHPSKGMKKIINAK